MSLQTDSSSIKNEINLTEINLTLTKLQNNHIFYPHTESFSMGLISTEPRGSHAKANE
ncbi:MAG: hypothetical protein ABEJ24_05420 [Candidatus Magasanikbacteria bacterium]